MPEETARELATIMRLKNPDVLVVRVSLFDDPQSAFFHFVPAHNPQALVTMLKRLASDHCLGLLKTVRDRLKDPMLDSTTRAALLKVEAEIEVNLKLSHPPGTAAAD